MLSNYTIVNRLYSQIETVSNVNTILAIKQSVQNNQSVILIFAFDFNTLYRNVIHHKLKSLMEE